MADLSALIPAYNRATLIGDAIESLLAQTLPPTEILVYDDGSTDRTSAVAARYDKVRIIRDDQNRGVSHARNVLLAECSTRYAAWQDSDDISNVYRLEKQFAALQSNGAPLSFCAWTYFKYVNHLQWRAEPVPFDRAGTRCMGGAMMDRDRCQTINFDLDITLGGEDLVWLREIELRYGRAIELAPLMYFVRRHRNRIGSIKLRREHKVKKAQSGEAYGRAMRRLDKLEA